MLATTHLRERPAALTIGATAQADDRALFSNYGACVDLFAPGYEIVSAGTANDTATRLLSGTSMAAPLVAGVAAVYRAANLSASSATVSQTLLNGSTSGIVTNTGTGSPNRLLYSWLSSAPPTTPHPHPDSDRNSDSDSSSDNHAYPDADTSTERR
jgi:subtilisin family serine protease